MPDPNASTASAVEPLWTVNDVARLIGCSTSAVYKWTERGAKRGDGYGPKLPCLRVGALVRFRPADVHAWLEGRTQEQPPTNVLQLRPVDAKTP